MHPSFPGPGQIEQSMDDGEGFQNEASIQAAAAAMAAALQGGGSDSRDSTQSPHASKRRKGANGQSAAAAAAAAAAALGSADSDYEVKTSQSANEQDVLRGDVVQHLQGGLLAVICCIQDAV